MIRSVSRLVFVLVFASAAAGAQTIPAGVAGKWEGKAMIGPKDSVITTNVMTATATTKGWTIQFPNRPLLQARVVAAGGDSVVVEVGPYESILRKGQQVVTRTTSHYKGDMSSGTFEAKYVVSGDVVKGKYTGKRIK
jgi:hypothetical protein